MTFHTQGESVWSELLASTRGVPPDAWTGRARTALWSRLGDRFLFLAEGDFPVAGSPDSPRSAKRDTEAPR
jgi:hypothetical protein